MLNLYELSEARRAVLDGAFAVDADTGEVFDDCNLDELDGTIAEKMDACACYLKELEASAKALRDEECSLAKRRHATEARAARFKDYLTRCLQTEGMRSFETPHAALSLRRSKAVSVLDVAKVPPIYIRRTVEEVPDKRAIMEALKRGATVPGCELEEREGLVMR